MYGEDQLKAHASRAYASSAQAIGPREANSVADAIIAVAGARTSLAGLAEMAEGLLAKVAGPIPPRNAPSTGEGSLGGPRGVVDQLHYEIRGMTDLLTRVEFALRDIDARIG